MRTILLCCLLGISLPALAQVSATFRLPHVEGATGNTVCLPVTVDNFTAAIEFSFTLRNQNGGGLTFNRVQNINPAVPNFDAGNFNLTDFLDEGVITIQWRNFRSDQDCSDAPGVVTLEDGAVLFEACYDAAGPLASNHPVEFYDKPDSRPFDDVDDSVFIFFNKRAQCNQSNDAFPETIDGSVTLGVAPLILDVADRPGNFQPGDVFCTDIVATSGFTELTGFQFGVTFDTSVLRVISRDANSLLPQNNDGAYNIFDGTKFYGAWTPFGSVVGTLPAFTNIVNVCFEVVGDCGDRSTIEIGEVLVSGSNPSPILANGSGEGLEEIPIIGGKTEFAIDNCNPEGFDVILACPVESPAFGDVGVCVDVQAGTDFVDMRKMDYLLSWNPNILAYSGIRNENPALDLTTDDFITAQSRQGLLFYDWDADVSTGNTLDSGEVVFSICFDVVGFGGVSPVAVADFRNDIESATLGVFNGLNVGNCAIEVERPPGVAVSFPESTGIRSSEDRCVDVTVAGFQSITGFSVNVSTNPLLLNYTSFEPSIPGISAESVADGVVQLSYTGETLDLPDGTVIGAVCYRARLDAEPGTCDTIQLPPFFPGEVFTTESAGMSVDVEGILGETCVLFPNGFGINIEDTEGPIDSEFCAPVDIYNFDNIGTAEVLFRFDPSLVRFEGIDLVDSGWPGLAVTDFDLTAVDIGIVRLAYTAAEAGGVSASGDTVRAFQFCFESLTTPGCFELSGEPDPEAEVATIANGEEGSIVIDNGAVCVADQIITEDVTPVAASCSDAADGEIIYTTAPRPGNEQIFIRTDNPVRTGTNGRVTGLRPGVQNYVLYTAGGSVQSTGTITIPFDPDGEAVADAGPDKSFSCTGPRVLLLDSQDNVGESWELRLLNDDGTSAFLSEGSVDNNGRASVVVENAGTHLFTVSSSSGCTQTDTVEILQGDTPIAEAGEEQVLGCSNVVVTLDAAGSSQGDNVRYRWERVDAATGEVLDVLSTERTVVTDVMGLYRLTVTFVDLSCTATDSVAVIADRTTPASDLPAATELACNGSGVLLSTGDSDEDIDYTWAELERGLGFPLGFENTFFAETAGQYIVELRNRRSGCAVVDTVSVNAGSSGPSILAPEFLTANCVPDTTLIRPLYQDLGDNPTFRWSTDDGDFPASDAEADTVRTLSEGTYKIVVTAQGCADSAVVTIGPPLFPIMVDAGEDQAFDCLEDITLVGFGSPPTEVNLDYVWTLDGVPVENGDTSTIMVNQPGAYVLTATVPMTGCGLTDTLLVTEPDDFPRFELADTVGGLGCAPSSVALMVSEPADSYEYEWRSPAGEVVATTQTIEAAEAGTYTLTVSNPASGCESTATVTVVADGAGVPLITATQTDSLLTCESPSVRIDAGATEGNDLAFEWLTVAGEQDVSDTLGPSLTVTEPGTFRLTVTDTLTSCSQSREFTVEDDRNQPNIEAVDFEDLNCERRATVLSITVLDQPNDYDIEWTDERMSTLPSDTTAITVTEAGTYRVTVSDLPNVCPATLTFVVEDRQDSLGSIVFSPVDSFGCNTATVTIEAEVTAPDGELTYTWASLDGNGVEPATGSPTVEVTGAGDYTLTVTLPSGCPISDTVSVFASQGTPAAIVPAEVAIDCGDMPQLDASASTPPPGDGVEYAWTALGAGTILSGGDGAMPFVDGLGTYQLVVTDLRNSCSDTAVVNVTVDEGERAVLPDDFSVCGGDTTVVANLPAGTTGTWSALDDENDTWSSDSTTATVIGLENSIRLIWTLSQPGCPDYSADTVRITRQGIPFPTDDLLQLTGGQVSGSINVLANDIRTGEITARLVSEPTFGTATLSPTGELTFEVPVGTTITTTVDYEVCSTVCSDRCATATVTVVVADTDTDDPQIYNAITPNGDGRNDVFIFELLEQRPEDFPVREFIVFNRWGDVVYSARPYANDWGGTNDGGDPLPEATYYYILRLDIGEGDIIRGDVTIIR